MSDKQTALTVRLWMHGVMALFWLAVGTAYLDHHYWLAFSAWAFGWQSATFIEKGCEKQRKEREVRRQEP